MTSPELSSYACVDLETTGLRPARDGITEVAIVVVENHKVVEEWSTLIDPGLHIPGKIQELTGITNQMLKGAPTFDQVADEILERLSDRVFIAHNARFDYGFLKSNFNRLGHDFNPVVLCTAKLSRSLFPQQGKHNLDTLIRVHGIKVDARHRALADAQVLHECLNIFHDRCGEEAVHSAISQQIEAPSLPRHLDKSALDPIKNTPGVYLFYGKNNSLLYIGKSIALRNRILSHFSSDIRSEKEMRISWQIRRIETIDTAGELGALILEAELVKSLKPGLNKRLRSSDLLYSFYWDINDDRSPTIMDMAEIEPAALTHCYGFYHQRDAAKQFLRQAAEEYRLCLKYLGLEKGEGACFAHQINKCDGLCVGKETITQHKLRLLEALLPIKIKPWPFKGRIGIREINTQNGLSEIHIFDHWCYLGKASNNEAFIDLMESPRFSLDADIYHVLTSYLNKKTQFEILELSTDRYDSNYSKT